MASKKVKAYMFLNLECWVSETMSDSAMTFGPEVHAVIQQEAPELMEYKDLFDTSTIGKLPVVYHMRLADTVHPTICAPRQVPLAMKTGL